jgi:Predicted amidohydrolase
MSKVTLGLLQHACSANPAENRKKTLALAEKAAKRGAQIICTQELFASQYFCQSENHEHFKLAETIPGPSTAAFQKLAKRYKVVIVASLFEKRASGLYHNTAVVIDADGSLLGVYRKMHIPDDPLFYEKFYFTPGDTGFRAWDTRYGKIGVLVCWDQWYPEGARLTAMQGAEILFYPTAIGWHPSEKAEYGANQHGAWETIQRSHAVANGCYVASVNRIGHEVIEGVGGDGLEFWGQSFVAGTSGQILAKASADKEEILIVPVELGKVDVTRTHWPFLRDRRIDAYGELTKRFIDRSF